MKNRDRKGKLTRKARLKLYLAWHRGQLSLYKAEIARLTAILDKVHRLVAGPQRERAQ